MEEKKTKNPFKPWVKATFRILSEIIGVGIGLYVGFCIWGPEEKTEVIKEEPVVCVGCDTTVMEAPKLEDIAVGFICNLEDFKPTPYPDAGGKAIGYGFNDEVLVARGYMTEPEAKAEVYRLVRDIDNMLLNDGICLTRCKQAAVISYIYNTGRGSWQKTRMRQKLKRRACDAEIIPEFLDSIKAGGKVMNGLVKRRNREVALYRRND